jgi:hypothetical protein
MSGIITPGCLTQIQAGLARARSAFQGATDEGWRLNGEIVQGSRVVIDSRFNQYASENEPDFVETCILEVPTCPKMLLTAGQHLTNKDKKATIRQQLSSINGCDRYRVDLCDC